ncbi:MAG TPA: hypothetical protein VIL97_10080 [Thermoanaerobaculia bacterium]
MRIRIGAAPHPLLVFLLIGLLHGAIAAVRGPLMSADSITYSRWVEHLRPATFHDRIRNAPPLSEYPRVLYTGWVTLLALAQSLFADHWKLAILALNVIANAAVAAMIVTMVHAETRDAVAGWVAFSLYLISFDLLLWTPFVLSDPTFLLISFGAFAVPMQASRSGRPRIAIVAAGALSALAIIYRPNGALIPLSLVAALIALRVKRTRPLILLATSTAACVLLLNAHLVQDPARWPGEDPPRALRYHAGLYQNGVVVYDRPDTFHAKPEALLDHVAISLDRLVQFFRITHPSFSTAHNLVSALFFVPAYLLALIALRFHRRGVPPSMTVSVVFVVVIWFFTSLAQIDFDWRYRLPMLPHLIFIAGVGASEMRRVFAQRRA